MAHCVYNTYFVLLWGSAVAAIPTALGLAVWLLASAIPHEHRHAGRIVTLTLVVMVLIAWTVALRRHATRVLIRAGAFPAWFGCDFYPHDELEFRQAVVDARDRTGSLPALVGGGWGYFLKRQGPDGPRLFTHHFTGLVHGSTTRWRAGTTIAQVQRAFQKRNQSLPSHPTMDYISLGSWVACANHGNDGDLIKDNVIESATVLDMMNDQQTTLAYRAARQLFDSADGPRFCVMDVTFKPVPNRMLQKRALKVETAQDAADWLAPGAHLRLLFLGAARDYAIGLRWESPYDASAHTDPHFCSRLCTFLQIDVFAAIGGWHEPMQKYNGKTTLYEANRWTPPIFPLMTLAVVLAGIKNFEIFFKLETALDGDTLFRIVADAIAMHKELGGRSELRYATPSRNTRVCWDISLARGFERPFAILAALGVRTVALHPGKYVVDSTAPCRRVAVSAL